MATDRLINKVCKTNGLSVRPAAARLLKESLTHYDMEKQEVIVRNMVAALKEKGALRGGLLEPHHVESFLQADREAGGGRGGEGEDEDEQMESGRNNNNVNTNGGGSQSSSLLSSSQSGLLSSQAPSIIRYISAFEMPRFIYNANRSLFTRVKESGKLHGVANDKATHLRDRFYLLQQRLSRNDLFNAPAYGSTRNDSHYRFTPIESLLGSQGPKIVFGLLTQIKEGVYALEDTTAYINVNLSEAQFVPGLFTQNTFVVARGELVDDVFKVIEIGFPSTEPRSQTLATHPVLDCFGLECDSREKQREKAMLAERLKTNHSDDLVVILCEVHLDRPLVMEKLRSLFEGYSPSPPPLFVFMGNFCSKSYQHSSDARFIKGLFDALGDLIAQFPDLVTTSKFLLVGGPRDGLAGTGHNVLPAPPLPSFITQKLQEVLGENFIAGSNPSRILFATKELVFFRDDLLHKMRRNCVSSPTGDKEVSEHLVKTVCEQSHLSPLPMAIRPVYWNYDHALRLYPLPHALFLGDVVDQYENSYEECVTANPGSFSTDFSFLGYYPAQDKVEFSRIPG